ncbi:hypothetical protein SAMN02800694_2824 [Luteibacter sp. UNCMF331Sha3.1]|uniref:AEC family transporter n=1 Tax=Luteibacter sp. UNCMF331Sha3.1 TaxID=1502760 RepID=UPI0008C60092|nr:AEC family transporter [Luteibacter sp. UNCMF331Sha3.1]SEN11815.1 hypothetical protein SAMN02800694_2824 [Luteibacter sp. UNCMF331Sha3.1]
MGALIVSALGPIVFVIGLGWLAGVRGLMPEGAGPALARFVVYFALPINLFVAAATSDPGKLFHPLFLLALGSGLVGLYVVGWLVSRYVFRRRGAEAALQALACSFPNMAYCGPPVLIAAAGQAGLLAVVAGNLFVCLITVPVTLVAIAGHRDGEGRGVGAALVHAVGQPLVFLPVAGTFVSVLGFRLSPIVLQAADEIGRTAAGVALFALGLVLSHTRPSLTRAIATNVLLKNVLQPALIFGVGFAVGLHGPLLKMAFLTGVLPSATEVSALSAARGVYVQESAATTLASTLFSVISITVGLAVAATLAP